MTVNGIAGTSLGGSAIGASTGIGGGTGGAGHGGTTIPPTQPGGSTGTTGSGSGSGSGSGGGAGTSTGGVTFGTYISFQDYFAYIPNFNNNGLASGSPSLPSGALSAAFPTASSGTGSQGSNSYQSVAEVRLAFLKALVELTKQRNAALLFPALPTKRLGNDTTIRTSLEPLSPLEIQAAYSAQALGGVTISAGQILSIVA